MYHYSENPAVCAAGCYALGSLAKHNHSAKIAEAGGVQAVLNVTKLHQCYNETQMMGYYAMGYIPKEYSS